MIHIEERGSGPVVVLLHGTPTPAADLLPLAERLAPRYRVLVPDLPGYGRTPAVPGASYEASDALLADAIVDRIGGRRVHALVGLSSGAYRAFELVLRRRLAAVHVVALGGIVNLDAEGRSVRRSIAAAIRENPAFLYGPELAAALRAMLSPSWAAAHPEDVTRVESWARLCAPAAFADELAAIATLADLRPELPQIVARVHLRVGALDAACPPSISEEIHTLVRGSSLDIVPGCGHLLLTEDEAATTDAIARALAT